MAKIKTVCSVSDFMKGDWREKAKKEKKADLKIWVSGCGTIITIMAPSIAFAAEGDTFANLHESILRLFDSGVVIVIMFAGAAWALGHRGKAIEILIGCCCGYLLARHAVDIRDFLKGV